jgi:ubiquinone/menaquinone biosynthesis C-methylase UbiE
VNINRLSKLITLLALIAAFVPGISAQQKSVSPDINKKYKDPKLKVTEWVERFEMEGREVYDQREKIVAATGVKEGDVVADVGAGTGLFTLIFAEKVGPEGKVLAVDIATPFLGNIAARADEKKIRNIDTILCTDRDARIRKETTDVVFICDTYHHFEYPQDTLATIHWGMKPGGTLVLVDFNRINGESSEWIMNHVRADKETFVKEIETSGFEKTDEADFLKENYLVKFKKKQK